MFKKYNKIILLRTIIRHAALMMVPPFVKKAPFMASYQMLCGLGQRKLLFGALVQNPSKDVLYYTGCFQERNLMRQFNGIFKCR